MEAGDTVGERVGLGGTGCGGRKRVGARQVQ